MTTADVWPDLPPVADDIVDRLIGDLQTMLDHPPPTVALANRARPLIALAILAGGVAALIVGYAQLLWEAIRAVTHG
jgi:hypothetical protein